LKRKPFLKLLVIVLALLGAALGLWGAFQFRRTETAREVKAPPQRFPRPQLPSTYKAPATEYPGPRGTVHEYVDTAVLLAALVLAAWLALKRRSRSGLFVLMLFSLAYFGFYRGGCVCPIGAIQHVVSALFHAGYLIPVTVLLFFILPLIVALFVGRVFCSSVCPLGAVQDLVLVRPMRVPSWLEHGLGLFAYVYLGLAVLFAATGAGYVVCMYDPFVSFFRLSGTMNMFVLGACFLLIAMFVGRPYCRYVCPYGVLLRLLSKVSLSRVTITPDECIQCRLCEDACPFGAIQKPTEGTARIPLSAGKVGLGLLILALPVIVVVGVLLGHASSGALAGMHPTVRQARAVRRDEAAKDASDEEPDPSALALMRTGKTPEQLYAIEASVLGQFEVGGSVFGAWVGLVIGVKLIALSVRRKRTDYEAEPGQCVACGRCFAYCPREHLRLKEFRGELSGRTGEKTT